METNKLKQQLNELSENFSLEVEDNKILLKTVLSNGKDFVIYLISDEKYVVDEAFIDGQKISKEVKINLSVNKAFEINEIEKQIESLGLKKDLSKIDFSCLEK